MANWTSPYVPVTLRAKADNPLRLHLRPRCVVHFHTPGYDTRSYRRFWNGGGVGKPICTIWRCLSVSMDLFYLPQLI